jgi:hypothetical protein
MPAERTGEIYDPMALYADVDATIPGTEEAVVIRTHPRGTGDWAGKLVFLTDRYGVPRAFPVENVLNPELFGELPTPYHQKNHRSATEDL